MPPLCTRSAGDRSVEITFEVCSRVWRGSPETAKMPSKTRSSSLAATCLRAGSRAGPEHDGGPGSGHPSAGHQHLPPGGRRLESRSPPHGCCSGNAEGCQSLIEYGSVADRRPKCGRDARPRVRCFRISITTPPHSEASGSGQWPESRMLPPVSCLPTPEISPVRNLKILRLFTSCRGCLPITPELRFRRSSSIFESIVAGSLARFGRR